MQMQMLLIFRGLENGINTCQGLRNTGMVYYDQLEHVAEEG